MVTAAPETAPRARSMPARLNNDGVVVHADANRESAIEAAASRRFLDQVLPTAVNVRIPYALAPMSIAPPALQITHEFTGPRHRFVRLDQPGVVEVIITESGRSTQVEILGRDHATAAALWDTVRARVQEQLHESAVTRCQMWSGSNGAYGRDHKVKASRWVDVRRNYPHATADQLDALMALDDPEDKGGLVLWHGPPGTGKTSAVRTLLTEWFPWCDAHIITDPEMFFSAPDYLLDVVEVAPRPDFRAPLRSFHELAPRRWKLIVCEDADEYLRSDARARSGPALGRLLNLTDGLLGEGSRTLVLLTTNDELGRIHPAVQRPGRCRASIQFPAFSPSEAAAWCPPAVPAPKSEKTLAELYALTRGQDVAEPEPSSGLYL